VVFLGAPHRETGKATLGEIAANAVAAVQPSLTNDVMCKLKISSEVFERVNDAFVKHVEKRGGTFKAITFYENVEEVPNLPKVSYVLDALSQADLPSLL
jgi:hypothetical protein